MFWDEIFASSGGVTMDCNHEFITLKSHKFAFSDQKSVQLCHKCNKTPREIELEQQLADLKKPVKKRCRTCRWYDVELTAWICKTCDNYSNWIAEEKGDECGVPH